MKKEERNLVFIDFDDTIVVSAVGFWGNYASFLAWLYEKIRERKSDDPSSNTPAIGDTLATLENYEAQNLVPLGYSPDRMIKSFTSVLMTYEIEIGHNEREKIKEFANFPFDYPLNIHDDIRLALAKLKENARVIVWTRGKKDIQERRIISCGLDKYIDQTYAFHEKNSDNLSESIRKELSMMPQEPIDIWMIGNSLQHDIMPAINIGIRAILVGIEGEIGTIFRSFDTANNLDIAANIVINGSKRNKQTTMKGMFK